MPWFSKCSPWASSVSVSWGHVRNAGAQASLRLTKSEILGEESCNMFCSKPSSGTIGP